MTQQEEVAMFGETVEQMERMKPSFYGNGMYAMAILSDVQEHLAMGGDRERARQWINKAKFFIGKET